jgi:hypothetical protein
MGATPMKDQEPDDMPDRWRRIVRRIVRGEEWRAAARAEGCSESYARVVKTRMMKHPAVVRELDMIRSAARQESAYTLLEHVKEIDWAIAGSAAKDNWMAVARLVRDKGEVFGHYIDRIQVETINLTGALAAAQTRVLNAGQMVPYRQSPVEIDPAVLASPYYTGPGAKHDPINGGD